MKKYIITLFVIFLALQVTAQEYEFTDLIDIEASEVKSQGNTGTCWSFSTSSFIENEIVRLTGKHIDISEMFTVRNTYDDKAWNYVMRQGKSQFSQGGLAHDVINAIEKNGLVPESVFEGAKTESKTYNHKLIIPQIKKILDTYIKNDKDSSFPNWKLEASKILDDEIGEVPSKFNFEAVNFTPKSFAKFLKIEPKNYITISSFSQVDFYKPFILNIPDNFSNGSMYNLPLDKLVHVVDYALKKGYTLALDVDVSEKTFSAKNGIAVLPNDKTDNKIALTELVTEKVITQEFRQAEFENYNTTDDHLMHIVGVVKDQNDNRYYKVKNSWGDNSKRIGNNGYIYMSVPYFKLKTISVLLHKDGLPKKINRKLDLD
ncbi:MAG: C1 family peptidase [Flavobacteriaceae bacterium]